MTESDSLQNLTAALRRFAEEREWDQYHTLGNLAAALSIEVAELQEHFLWATPLEAAHAAEEKRAQIAEEIGDVLLYLIRFADKVNVDPIEAAQAKLKVNAQKYPVDKSRGNHKKYTEL